MNQHINIPSKNDGVLIINLGSPKALDLPSVKEYLAEFLMDPCVIDIPFLIRYLLVKGIIVPFRSPKTLEAYETVWTDEGSPLITITEEFVDKFKKNCPAKVEIAMRYAQPSIETGIQALVDSGVQSIYLAPMYPQYAMATTQTVEDKCREVISKLNLDLPIYTLSPFYQDQRYIQALADSINPYLKGIGIICFAVTMGFQLDTLKKVTQASRIVEKLKIVAKPLVKQLGHIVMIISSNRRQNSYKSA